jgi:hypothetical protein
MMISKHKHQSSLLLKLFPNKAYSGSVDLVFNANRDHNNPMLNMPETDVLPIDVTPTAMILDNVLEDISLHQLCLNKKYDFRPNRGFVSYPYKGISSFMRYPPP